MNYVEIGKTLEDLTFDDDHYISDDAFRPFKHYSADFVVMLADSNVIEVSERRLKIAKYYKKHHKFFLDRNLGPTHPHLAAGRIPLADIDTIPGNIVQLLSTRQYVNSVYFE